MLHKARRRIMLGQRALAAIHGSAVGGKQNGAGRCRAFVDNNDIFAHASIAESRRPSLLQIKTARLPKMMRFTVNAVNTQVTRTIAMTSI